MGFKKKPDEQPKSNPPVWSKRVPGDGGFLECALFAKQMTGDNGDWTAFSLSIKRSYKDAQGNWQSGTSFRLNDAPILALLLQEAWAQATNTAE